jgi:nucleoside-diphosphate-sugar epimerase
MQQPKYHLQIKPHLFIIVFAKNILAYKPSHTLKNGLKEAVDWLLSLWLLSTRGEHSW